MYLGKQLVQEIVGGLPGIDEAVSFSQIFKWAFTGFISLFLLYYSKNVDSQNSYERKGF